MKYSTPNFSPFTKRQLDRIEELKAEIEKRNRLSALDPEMPKINRKIDDLSGKVLRFTMENLPKESRRPGEFIIEVSTSGGRLHPNKQCLDIKPGFGVFRPDLPPWVKNHLVEWIQMLILRRADARDVLRETGIVGIETGVKLPEDFAEIERWELIKRRVLELRGVEEKKKPHGIVTEEMLSQARQQSTAGEQRKRIRKNLITWEMIIDQLVEEELLSKKITRQGFKDLLKKHFPDYPWNKV